MNVRPLPPGEDSHIEPPPDPTSSDARASKRYDYDLHSTPVRVESIDQSKRGVCRISNKVRRTSGSAFVCNVKISRKRYVTGIVTSAHIMPNIKDKDKTKLKDYEIIFEHGPNARKAGCTLDKCVSGVIRMPPLDAVFLELDKKTAKIYSKQLRVKDVVDVAAETNVYTEGRSFFLLGFPDGGLLHSSSGIIGPNSETDVFVPHSASTIQGCSGAPLFDCATGKIICVHKGKLDQSKKKRFFHRRAVKIIPIVERIKSHYLNKNNRGMLDADNSTPRQVTSARAVTEQRSEGQSWRLSSMSILPCINNVPVSTPIPAADDGEVMSPTLGRGQAETASLREVTCNNSASLKGGKGSLICIMIRAVMPVNFLIHSMFYVHFVVLCEERVGKNVLVLIYCTCSAVVECCRLLYACTERLLYGRTKRHADD